MTPAKDSILAVLGKLISNSPQKWYEWVDFVLMSIRTAIHRSSGFSPFQLMFGRVWNPLADYHQVALDFEAINSVHEELEVVESALVARASQLRTHLWWVESRRYDSHLPDLSFYRPALLH